MWRPTKPLRIDIPPFVAPRPDWSFGSPFGTRTSTSPHILPTPVIPALPSISKTLFRGLVCYVEQPKTTDGLAQGRRVKGVIQWSGGKLTDRIDDAAITHIILISPKAPRSGASETTALSLNKKSTGVLSSAQALVQRYGQTEGTLRSQAESGVIVVREDWVQACIAAGQLVDPTHHCVRDRLAGEAVADINGESELAPCAARQTEVSWRRPVTRALLNGRTVIEEARTASPVVIGRTRSPARRVPRPQVETLPDRILVAEVELDGTDIAVSSDNYLDLKVSQQPLAYSDELAVSASPTSVHIDLAESLFPREHPECQHATRRTPSILFDSPTGPLKIAIGPNAPASAAGMSLLRDVPEDNGAEAHRGIFEPSTGMLAESACRGRRVLAHREEEANTPEAVPDTDASPPVKSLGESCPGGPSTSTEVKSPLASRSAAPTRGVTLAIESSEHHPSTRATRGRFSGNCVSVSSSPRSSRARAEDFFPGPLCQTLICENRFFEPGSGQDYEDGQAGSSHEVSHTGKRARPPTPVSDSDDDDDLRELEESGGTTSPLRRTANLSSPVSESTLSHITVAPLSPMVSHESKEVKIGTIHVDRPCRDFESGAAVAAENMLSLPQRIASSLIPALPYMRTPIGLPYSFYVSANPSARQKFELLIEFLGGGFITGITRATFVVIHVEDEGKGVTLAKDELQAVVEAMEDPSRAVVTGYWIDHCTNVSRLLDHRAYEMKVFGDVVQQIAPTPSQPFDCARLSPITGISTRYSQAAPATIGKPITPLREEDAVQKRGRRRPRKSAPPLPGPGLLVSQRTHAPPSLKRPRQSEPVMLRRRSKSTDTTWTSLIAESIPSGSEMRPTLRSDLSCIIGDHRDTYLGLGRRELDAPARKRSTWEVIENMEDVESEDEMQLHLLADSLNIWIEEHMPAGVTRIQAGWSKSRFLLDLTDNSPMPHPYDALYKKYKPVLYDLVPAFHRLEGKRKQGWKGWALVPVEGEDDEGEKVD